MESVDPKKFTPQDFQLPFVTSTAPFPSRIAPWGDGKTACMIMMGLQLSQMYPGNEGLILRNQYKALQRSTIRDFEFWTGLKVPEQKQSVTLEGCDSVIHFSHCDNVEEFRTTLQGMNLGWAGIEQADELESADVFEMLIGRLRRILTPRRDIQEALIEWGVMKKYVPDFRTLKKDERNRIEKAIIEKLHLPVRQIIPIANACGHNWMYKRWHPDKNPLPGYELHIGKPFENEENLPETTLENWRQLKITSIKKYNRYVLNSFEDYDIEGAYYASLMSDALKDKRVECSTLYDKTIPVYTFWDLGVSDDTAIWFVQFVGQSIHLIDYYKSSGQGMEHYSKILDEKKYRYKEHWLPHDAKHRIQGKKVTTRLKILRQLRAGEDVYTLPKHSVEEGIEAVRSILGKCKFDEKCEEGVECMNRYHREVNKIKSSEEEPVFLDRPAHDRWSHGADAFRYLAIGYRFSVCDTSGMVIGATEVLPARLATDGVNNLKAGSKKRKYDPLHHFTSRKRKTG